MSFKTLVVETNNRIGWIRFNRPEVLNAYNSVVSKELIDVLDNMKNNREARVIVITGSGKAFMSGADISMLRGWMEKLNEGESFDEIIGPFFQPSMLENFPKPVVAAVNGFAFGMGCEIAMGCDIRIAAESARFGQPEIDLGVIPGSGGTQRLPRLIGKSKAMEMILTGKGIKAKEALKLGLVNRVVPDGELENATLEICEILSRKSPVALSLCKEAVIKGYEMTLEEGLKNEIDLFGQSLKTSNASEGVSAFLEKREAQFT